jgi:hypothetical protein
VEKERLIRSKSAKEAPKVGIEVIDERCNAEDYESLSALTEVSDYQLTFNVTECYISLHITLSGTVVRRDGNLRECEPSRDEKR